MQLDSIVALLKYINSYVEDDSDDNISEPELFDYFCNIVRKIDIEKGIIFSEIDLYINKVGTNKDGTNRSEKCIHGGAAFIWPVKAKGSHFLSDCLF